MNFDYPQIDLPCEIVAWPDVTEDILNLYKQSCRLKAGVFAVCLEGSIKVTINLIDYEIKQNDLITLLPGSIIQFHEMTDKVRLAFIGFSSECLGRINLIKMLMNTFRKITEFPIVSLKPNIAAYLSDYFSLVSRVTYDETIKLRSDQVEIAMKSVITSVDAVYSTHPSETHPGGRKEEICKELVLAITQNYTTERRVQFYADKLGISPQHLSTTVKQVTGKNVMDIISYVVIMDAKAKLKSTTMTIQEVAYSLNFPSASFFGKYFRRYVGMTPLEFRNGKINN